MAKKYIDVNEYYAIMSGGSNESGSWVWPSYNDEFGKPRIGRYRLAPKNSGVFSAPKYNDSSGKPITTETNETSKRKAVIDTGLSSFLDSGKATVPTIWDRSIILQHSFAVTIPTAGIIVGNFSRVSGLQKELILESYREGGDNGKEHYFPSHYNQSRIVLEGALITPDALDIMMKTMETGVFIKHEMLITLLDNNIPAAMWSVFDVYPVKISGPDFDALSSQPATTSIELIHSGIERLL